MQRSETKFASIFEKDRHLNLLQLSDTKLRTDDGCNFNVHRVTLARSSDFFRAMFCATGEERNEFGIPGISGECLSDILRYVYTGDIEVTEGNARDLMIAADYLLLKDLRKEINQKIKAYMTEVNCLRILKMAHQITDEDLFRECFRFITTRFEGVMRCQKNDLADLPLDILISILSNRSLYVYNESTVWQAIVEWTQKDIPLRMSYILQLLLTLAMEDVGEELATEILQHEIISQNPLFRRIRKRRDLQSNQISKLQVLLSFLRSCSTRFRTPKVCRFPLKLHVMSFPTGAGTVHSLYVTYDENPDLWRKITDMSCEPKAIVTVRHNIYTHEYNGQVWKFNLRTMIDWKTVSKFRHVYEEFIVVGTVSQLYVLGEIFNETGKRTYNVELYDTENDRWSDGVSLHNIFEVSAVAIGENIYVVGNTNGVGGTMMQMFNPVTQQWSRLSPPTVYNSTFSLVTYHQKIYMIGSYLEQHCLERLDIEVFDPDKNLWEKLPCLPYTFSTPGSVVFNDQLIFLDRSDGYERNPKKVRWNDVKKCWDDKFDKRYSLEDLHRLKSSCISDIGIISTITKQNRDPKTKMEKSLFN